MEVHNLIYLESRFCNVLETLFDVSLHYIRDTLVTQSHINIKYEYLEGNLSIFLRPVWHSVYTRTITQSSTCLNLVQDLTVHFYNL